MANVMHEIREWINTQPFWEQAALEKALVGTPITDGDYAQFFQLLQEDAGLLPRTSRRPELHQLQRAGMTVRPRTAAPRLVEIATVHNVNALDSQQRLTFGSGVTLVYGANGSGKTGYARILASAGFSRGDNEVLPNVMVGSTRATSPASADVTLSDGSTASVHHFVAGTRCAELGRIYVFDSTSVTRQLTLASSFNFSPSGLSCLADLTGIVDRVRDLLDAKVRECRQLPAFVNEFSPDSEVGAQLKGLGAKTDLALLKRLGVLSAAEQARGGDIETEIAQLRTRDTSGRVAELTRAIADLGGLRQSLDRLRQSVDEPVLQSAVRASETLLAAQRAMQQTGAEQFNSDGFGRAGTREWLELVTAARRLTRDQDTYPAMGDSCVLCQQELGDEARDLLQRIWRHLEDDAEARSAQARAQVADSRGRLAGIDIDVCAEQSVQHRQLQQHAPDAVADVHAFVATAAARRAWALRLLDGADNEPVSAPPPLGDVPAAGLAAVTTRLEQDRAQLQADDPTQQIARLRAEAVLLDQRRALAGYLPVVEAFIEQQKWADRLAKLKPSTTNITVKHNQLFDSLVTERYTELFQETLDSLGRPLNVKVATRGQKGIKLKSLALAIDPSAKITADRVLSDGEKRAVALADFLAEVRLDEASAGIVLDDPTTALDEQWTAAVARRLAEEAHNRQVIVFTHDLPFAFLLKRHCGESTVDLVCHEMRRNARTNAAGEIVLDGGLLVSAAEGLVLASGESV